MTMKPFIKDFVVNLLESARNIIAIYVRIKKIGMAISFVRFKFHKERVY